jgi:hypothetical protein
MNDRSVHPRSSNVKPASRRKPMVGSRRPATPRPGTALLGRWIMAPDELHMFFIPAGDTAYEPLTGWWWDHAA